MNGDIIAPRVSIVDGAEFNGSVKMPARAAAEAKKPRKPVAPAIKPESAAPLSDAQAAALLGEHSEL